MRANEFIVEGGWANPATQNTHITPALVVSAFKVMKEFIVSLNKVLTQKNIPTVELGPPCGSTTYYKRDLQVNPTKEYGDIDVSLFIPRIEGMTNNANATLYQNEIKEFCDNSSNFQTANGTNVIFNIDSDFIQVDFVTAYSENRAWTTALAPEWNVKGVLCNSIYSSLGEVLSLSMGGAHGVQAKLKNGELVPFRTIKDTVLKTITNDPKNWAIDIVNFFGCIDYAPLLKQFPGMIGGEVRVSDMINSIKGIAQTLEMNGKGSADEMLAKVRDIYLGKINNVIGSSKFNKASTPAAIQKAADTKKMLADKSAEFAKLFQ